MSGNLNKVFLVGNLTRDPELKYTTQGTAVAKFSMAVNRQFRGNDGETKKEVNFFNIVVWGKAGENCSKYLSKGRSVLVEGRLQNRSFETQDKQKRTVTEIVADNVQFLSGPSGSPPGGGSPRAHGVDAAGDEFPGDEFGDADSYGDTDGSIVPF